MIPIARQTDLTIGGCLICGMPVGIIISGAPNVITQNLPTSTQSDIIICLSGHPSIIVNGSSITFTNKKPTARIGDVYAGCKVGVLATGATKVFSK